MKRFKVVVLSLFVVLASFSICLAGQPDVKGSKDHPMISRMPNFHISDYQDKEYSNFDFPLKDKRTPVEGHYYYLNYDIDSGAPQPGELKIVRNIQNALKKIGGKVLYETNSSSTIMVKKGNKETWVHVGAWPTIYRLWIIEKEEMQQEVVANAEAMGNDINTTGHASVYDILFDTGKSAIKPESDAAISEIAKMLKSNAALKIYVVGHTDNVGSFDSNMKLSKDRADAVAKALATKHGIAAARLKAYGMSSLSPVASNKTDEGKAKNRRVELVEQ